MEQDKGKGKAIETYVGDGVYASYDGVAIDLVTPRQNGDHWISLEADVFANFIRYALEIEFFKKIIKEVVDVHEKNGG